MPANSVPEDKATTDVQIVAPYYEVDADDRIRIAIKHKDTWRLFFWFQVKKDGSIYAGPRYEEITYVAKGVKQVKGGGSVDIDFRYDGGEIITNPDIVKGAKMSFHGSGVIHAAGERILGKSLRELEKPELLCYVLFSHPSNYAVIPVPQKVKKHDVFLTYPIDEGRPLQADLIVSPISNIPLIYKKDAVYQVPLIFRFLKMDNNVSDIAVQIVFWHKAIGQWPPYTFILYTGK